MGFFTGFVIGLIGGLICGVILYRLYAAKIIADAQAVLDKAKGA